MINSVRKPLTFTVPLSYEAHAIAQQYCQGITQPSKSQQVYLNTLAVYAVNYYLGGMGFKTDWEQSDSRDPIAVNIANVADLSLNHLGKVECCPILADEAVFEISPEVAGERIAYIAVQFPPSLKEATILGYIQQPTTKVLIDQLQSLEDLLFYLSELEVEALTPVAVGIHSQQNNNGLMVSQLGKWLEGTIEDGWQLLEEMFTPQQLGLAFMNEVSVIRGQELDFEGPLKQTSVALVTKVISTETTDNPEVDILMQIRPIKDITLPLGITLKIKDTSGETVLEATSRQEDNWIQLAFSAEYGESFQVVVMYQDAVLTKNFVI